MCRAEAEAKLKMEKVNEIKKINAMMMAIKSEISKYEDTLKEYQLYRRFLDALTPPVRRKTMKTSPHHIHVMNEVVFFVSCLFVVVVLLTHTIV